MSDAAENPPPPAAPPAAPAPTPSPGASRERVIVIGLLVAVAAYAISQGSIDRSTLILIAVIVPSIILHEIAHGAVANAFGDDTAKRAGRLTLNPLAHIDPFGTIIMPAMLAMSGLTPFGFAKPVPVNVGRLRRPRNHGLLVSLAGPATNFTIALLAAAAFRIVGTDALVDHDLFGDGQLTVLGEFIVGFGVLNAFLGAFNLLPVPPLDGSAMLERVLPQSLWPQYLRFRRYSMFLVLIVVFWFPGIIQSVTDPAYDLWVKIAGG
jgi:Zn-dependent protease